MRKYYSRKAEKQNDGSSWSESAIGFIVLAVLIVVVALVYALLGLEPPKIGPLPWMAQ